MGRATWSPSRRANAYYVGVASRERYTVERSTSLHDIDDVRAFAKAIVARFIKPQMGEESDRDELIQEAVCLLYELAERFEPHREGYAQPGKFSGYAARFLPGKVIDAWHRLHPEHQCVTQPDGKRRWVYDIPKTVSEQSVSTRNKVDTTDELGEWDGGRDCLQSRGVRVTPLALAVAYASLPGTLALRRHTATSAAA